MSGYSVAESMVGVNSPQLPDLPDPNADTINPNFVMSRYPNGKPLSWYHSDSWNLKGYSKSKYNANWNFLTWGKRSENIALFDEITEQIKAVQFTRWNLYPHDRQPSSCGPSLIRGIAERAYKQGVSAFEYLTDKRFDKEHIKTYQGWSGKPQNEMACLLRELGAYADVAPLKSYGLSHERLFELREKLESFYTFKGVERELLQKKHQHLCLPSRQYTATIEAISSRLEGYYGLGDNLVELYRERNKFTDWRKQYFGTTEGKSRSGGDMKNLHPWATVMEQHGLTEFIERENIYGWYELRNNINSAIRLARMWLMLFSGMRIGEVSRLTSNTFQKVRVEGGKATVLKGYTSKTLGGSAIIPTCWITTDLVRDACDFAQKMSRIVCIEHGLDESLVGLGDFPLFVSWRNFDPEKDVNLEYATAHIMGHEHEDEYRWLETLPEMVVTQEDINEILEINPLSDLDWHGIKAGDPWHFENHQFRRSLAIYAVRSGRVSLGALKYQFQHLTHEMTLYYQNGGIFARDLLAGKDKETKSLVALISEIAEARVDAQATLWKEVVIEAKEPLFGGEGNRIQVAKDSGKPLLIFTDREHTKALIKTGKLAIKEGPMMYCTNPAPCDKVGLTLLSECPGCEFSIGNSKSLVKFEKTVRRLERARDAYPLESPFYKQLDDEISGARKSVQKQTASWGNA